LYLARASGQQWPTAGSAGSRVVSPRANTIQILSIPFRGRLVTLLVVLIACFTPPASGQDHTYSSADIEAGVRLYAADCALCHGPNGDMVNGVDLRRGRCRRGRCEQEFV
jgi:mono/diheme cytochrome c family protein